MCVYVCVCVCIYIYWFVSSNFLLYYFYHYTSLWQRVEDQRIKRIYTRKQKYVKGAAMSRYGRGFSRWFSERRNGVFSEFIYPGYEGVYLSGVRMNLAGVQRAGFISEFIRGTSEFIRGTKGWIYQCIIRGTNEFIWGTKG